MLATIVAFSVLSSNAWAIDPDQKDTSTPSVACPQDSTSVPGHSLFAADKPAEQGSGSLHAALQPSSPTPDEINSQRHPLMESDDESDESETEEFASDSDNAYIEFPPEARAYNLSPTAQANFDLVKAGSIPGGNLPTLFSSILLADLNIDMPPSVCEKVFSDTMEISGHPNDFKATQEDITWEIRCLITALKSDS